MTAHKSRNRYTLANFRFHLFRTLVMPFLTLPRSVAPRPPVVIGAIGGSGTRVLPGVLRLAGFWMGSWINPQTQDSMTTRYFLQRHFMELAGHRAFDDETLVQDFRRMIVAHRWGMPHPEDPWGWKNPRNMWIIPFLHRVYPEMKFIHVVRDGRDMALSDNTNLLRKHGAFLLPEAAGTRTREAAQLTLWTLGNRLAYQEATQYLGANYLMLNYETLCARPRETLARLFEFLGEPADEARLESACRLVIPSRGIGLWKRSGIPLLQDPGAETRAVLRLFGYDD